MIINGRSDMIADPLADGIGQLHLRNRHTAATCDAYFRDGFTVVAQGCHPRRAPPRNDHADQAAAAPGYRPHRTTGGHRGPGNSPGQDRLPDVNPCRARQHPARPDTRLGLWIDTTGQAPAGTVQEIFTGPGPRPASHDHRPGQADLRPVRPPVLPAAHSPRRLRFAAPACKQPWTSAVPAPAAAPCRPPTGRAPTTKAGCTAASPGR
jgi:hypothetical protein